MLCVTVQFIASWFPSGGHVDLTVFVIVCGYRINFQQIRRKCYYIYVVQNIKTAFVTNIRPQKCIFRTTTAHAHHEFVVGLCAEECPFQRNIFIFLEWMRQSGRKPSTYSHNDTTGNSYLTEYSTV
ncbi:Hypothetical_protein [Hexamita inflata]|uniref:Hypothetical_protein n=1 Tax=Hexamita inflata TaxID=28002 RepID=A0AA86PGZ8_9EUKA|nr:Hypothetical protein HINF_LOCUS26809 [Hexamita inflata]